MITYKRMQKGHILSRIRMREGKPIYMKHNLYEIHT